jgi:hypothetical protein
MKLTQTYLKRIIQEELQKVLLEQRMPEIPDIDKMFQQVQGQAGGGGIPDIGKMIQQYAPSGEGNYERSTSTDTGPIKQAWSKDEYTSTKNPKEVWGNMFGPDSSLGKLFSKWGMDMGDFESASKTFERASSEQIENLARRAGKETGVDPRAFNKLFQMAGTDDPEKSVKSLLDDEDFSKLLQPDVEEKLDTEADVERLMKLNQSFMKLN